MKIFVVGLENDCGECENESIIPIQAFTLKKDAESYIIYSTEPSLIYDKTYTEYVKNCQKIIRSYLINNFDAIDDFNHTNPKLSSTEKNGIINFLVNNWWYCRGKNIVSLPNGFIRKYCNIKLLKKPYPSIQTFKLVAPNPYYYKDSFVIREIELCNNKK